MENKPFKFDSTSACRALNILGDGQYVINEFLLDKSGFISGIIYEKDTIWKVTFSDGMIVVRFLDSAGISFDHVIRDESARIAERFQKFYSYNYNISIGIANINTTEIIFEVFKND